MADAGRELYREDMESLLYLLNEELRTLNLTAEMEICGGAVFVLEGYRDASTDVDCMFYPSVTLGRVRGKVAKKFGIEDDWINIDVNGIFSLIKVAKKEFSLFREYSNLKVFRVSDRILLAMKVMAARDREDKSDFPDTITLLKNLKLATYKEALEFLESLREETAFDDGVDEIPLFTLKEKNKQFLKKAVEMVRKDKALKTSEFGKK
jgi:hypothetical protein